MAKAEGNDLLRKWVRDARLWLVVALVALVVCLCSRPSEPPPPPPPPNSCDWPNLECQPGKPAFLLLDEIAGFARQGIDKRHLTPDEYELILEFVGAAKQPEFRINGEHICSFPNACEKLTELHDGARQAAREDDPDRARELWDDVLGGLQGFPSGN